MFVSQKNDEKLHLDAKETNEIKLEGRVEREDESQVENVRSSKVFFDWGSRRKTTDIIHSLKRRVAMKNCLSTEQSKDNAIEGSSSPPQSEKNLSLDEKLVELVPEWKCLSFAAQQSLSLDRNRSLFKSAPTYNTLECMFGVSMSNTTSVCDAYDSNNSLQSSSRSTDSGKPALRSMELDQSENSSSGESDMFSESAADGGAEDDAKPNVLDNSGDESPSRPGFFKSSSSPSKIISYGQPNQSSESSRGSLEEGPGRSYEGDEKPSLSESSSSANQCPNFEEASESPSCKMMKTPRTSITLSSDELENEDQKMYRSEVEEIEEALNSPAFKKSFRKRTGALCGRHRTSSAPNSTCFHFPRLGVQDTCL